MLLPRLSETERKVQLNTGHIAVFDHDLLTELALTLGAFALEQVPPTSLRPNDLACGGKLETLGHRLLGFATGDCFWHGAWTITELGPLGNREVWEIPDFTKGEGV
jgi:hypothetical protein